EQVSVALGLAVNTESGGVDASVAGSVSVSHTRNQTAATLEEAVINSEQGVNGDQLQVLAYDRTYLGTGGGTLTYGGKGGVGLAVTYSDIGNLTKAQILNKSVI